jgi:hypothetical protein
VVHVCWSSRDYSDFVHFLAAQSLLDRLCHSSDFVFPCCCSVLQPAPPGQSFVQPSRKLARWLRFMFDSVLLIYFLSPGCCPREFLGIGSGHRSPVRICFCYRLDFSLAVVFVHASVTRSRRFRSLLDFARPTGQGGTRPAHV